MNEKLTELQEKLNKYKKYEQDILKKEGIEDILIKAKEEYQQFHEAYQKQKEIIKQIEDKRNKLFFNIITKLSTEMNKYLTRGIASVKIEQGKLRIGWIIDNIYKPYTNLSGGEKVEMNNALIQTLLQPTEHDIVFIELAELDINSAQAMLEKIGNQIPQTIVCNWQKLVTLPNHWNLIDIEKQLQQSLQQPKQQEQSKEQKQQIEKEKEKQLNKSENSVNLETKNLILEIGKLQKKLNLNEKQMLDLFRKHGTPQKVYKVLLTIEAEKEKERKEQ